MRRYFACFLCILLLCSQGLCADAAENLLMVVDNANLLSEEECTALEELAQTVRSEYELDVVILTIDSLNGSQAQYYADDFFDQQGYGYGTYGDGVLLLLAMEEREWYISTCGNTIYALTDYGIQKLGEEAVWYFSEGDYYGGFSAFLNSLPRYLDAFSNNVPVDGYADYSDDYYHGDLEETVYYEESTTPNLFLSLVIGATAAAIVIIFMRNSMNTKKLQVGAADYMESGSFHVYTHQDMFLYSNIHKTRRQEPSGGSVGGGSSVHRSSGGRRHGGGGGRF